MVVCKNSYMFVHTQRKIMNLEQFKINIEENPLEFQLVVHGNYFWFKSTGVVPKSDGGKFEDDIVDVYMKHDYYGEVYAVAQVDVKDNMLWNYQITNNQLSEDAPMHFAKS